MEAGTEAESNADTKQSGAARGLIVTLTYIDHNRYQGWDGRDGCEGCGIDGARMAEILNLEGFEITSLHDSRATRDAVLGALRDAAAQSVDGDTFLFFIAAHGLQRLDQNGDEEPEYAGRPGYDETLVCFDGEIVDDELDEIWKRFSAGVVIYMISDTCNSGTNHRELVRQGKDPKPLLGIGAAAGNEMKARLLHLGGCRDGSVSYGFSDGGDFTTSLASSWNGGFGAQTWEALYSESKQSLSHQLPALNTYGPGAAELRRARPFSHFSAYPLPDVTAGEGTGKLRLAETREDSLEAGELTPYSLIPDGGAGDPQLPISEAEARKGTRWLMTNFGDELRMAADGTPFGPDLLCAIACQETAFFWLPLLEELERRPYYQQHPAELAATVAARCVLDAGGDLAGSARSAFPPDTPAFRERFGEDFTDSLIDETNLTRVLCGYAPQQWIYKSYGIFPVDLEHVLENEDFFRERQWYDFSASLDRCMERLNQNHNNGNLWETVGSFKGSGPRAEQYRDNVKQFQPWTADEIKRIAADSGTGRGLLRRTTSTTRRRGRIIPRQAPRLSQSDLAVKLAPYQIDRATHPLVIVGIRGYYPDMGKRGVNDRGIYDDAIFIDSPHGFKGYNGNTDPSSFRPGHGTDASKGMAMLKPGLYFCYKFDTYQPPGGRGYPAICQRLGNITVIRDGNPPYEHTDPNLGINIHCGGYHNTSSEGCQTLHPRQWSAFYQLAKRLAKRYHGNKWNLAPIPYVLIDESASPGMT